MTTIDEQIETNLQKMLQLKTNEKSACTSIDLEIADKQEEMQALLNKRQEITEPIFNEYNGIMDATETLSIQLGASMKSRYGKVTFKKGYTQTTYPKKKLEELGAQYPDMFAIIKTVRKVATIEPSTKIEIYSIPIADDVPNPNIIEA